MPVLMDGNPISSRLGAKSAGARNRPMGNGQVRDSRDGIRVALINNMPDAALEDTEMQFRELLDGASGGIPVSLSFYSLPEVPRGERALQHISQRYCGIDSLWNSGVDSVIITGTEPRQSDLKCEPYWQALAEVFDWAERRTVSAVLSCLAAHAAVLHHEGIPRQPLGGKLSGVFESTSVSHPLTRDAAVPLRFPHSRWNEVREQALQSCGYSVLTRSPHAGADLFVKRRKKSLFVHFQGHPEYASETLLKEYRRDVKRFLRGERETYPAMPQGYFDQKSAKALTDFQENAFSHRTEAQMELFPGNVVVDRGSDWSATAGCIYRNWLHYIASRIEERNAFLAVAQSCDAVPQPPAGDWRNNSNAFPSENNRLCHTEADARPAEPACEAVQTGGAPAAAKLRVAQFADFPPWPNLNYAAA